MNQDKMKMSKKSLFLGIFFIVLVLFLISICEATQTQLTPTPHYYVTPQDREWFENRLMLSGFTDGLPKELLSELKKEIILSDTQMKNLIDLGNLFTELRQMNSHDSPEPIPVNPKEGKTLNERCVEGAIQLHQILGDEKFNDLCEWVSERAEIDDSIDRLISKKKDISNVDLMSKDIFTTITNSEAYKKYKDEKSSKTNAD